MTPEQNALNTEIYQAWKEAGCPPSLVAFHDGYSAALRKANGEIAELRRQLAYECHDAARRY